MTLLRVSDHAVIRYLERVCGYDIDGLRSQIADQIAERRRADTPYVRLHGTSFVVREENGRSIVTTVLTPKKPKRRRRKHGDV